MTQSKSGIRRAWVGFSALAFTICGVLLLVRYNGRLGAPPASSSPSMVQTAPSMAQTAPTSGTARPPITAPVLNKEASIKPLVIDEPAKLDDLQRTRSLPRASLSTKKGKALEESGSLGHAGASSGSHAGYGASPGKLGGPAHPTLKPPALRAPLADRGAEPESPPSNVPAGETPDKPPAPAGAGKPGPTAAAAAGAATPAEPTLTEGVLKVNVPPTMIVGQSEHVRAVVGAKIHVDLVDKEAALETNDGARVQIGRDLMISTLVRMDLRGDSASEFDITSLSPDSTQHISDNDATVWEWSVTPKLEGQHSLTLLVSDLKEGTREALRNKIYPVRIDVHVTAWQRVRDVASTGSTLLSGLAGLIGAWLGLLRPLLQRRTPEGGPSATRLPPGTAMPPLTSPPLASPAVAHTAAAAAHPAHLATAPPAAAAHPAPAAPAATTATDALAMDVAVAASPPVAAVLPPSTAAAADPVVTTPSPSATDKPASS